MDSASHGSSQVAVEGQQGQPDHRGQGRAQHPRHATQGDGQGQPGEDENVGDQGDEARVPHVVVQVSLREQAAESQGGDAEAQCVPAAALVDPGREQRGQQQVEDHLVGERPHDVGHVLPAQHVRHHEQLRQDRRKGMRILAAQAADVHRRQHQGEDDGEQVQRVEAEDPADPEGPHAALALQRRGHDVAADNEEDEDAVIAGVDPVVDRVVDRLGDEGAEVVEDHAQGRDPAQHVEPGQPAARPRRGALPGGRGRRPVADGRWVRRSGRVLRSVRSGQSFGHRQEPQMSSSTLHGTCMAKHTPCARGPAQHELTPTGVPRTVRHITFSKIILPDVSRSAQPDAGRPAASGHRAGIAATITLVPSAASSTGRAADS